MTHTFLKIGDDISLLDISIVVLSLKFYIPILMTEIVKSEKQKLKC